MASRSRSVRAPPGHPTLLYFGYTHARTSAPRPCSTSATRCSALPADLRTHGRRRLRHHRRQARHRTGDRTLAGQVRHRPAEPLRRAARKPGRRSTRRRPRRTSSWPRTRASSTRRKSCSTVRTTTRAWSSCRTPTRPSRSPTICRWLPSDRFDARSSSFREMDNHPPLAGHRRPGWSWAWSGSGPPGPR